ncbi:MAG: DUF1559 domain-containing protein [Pirellulales bacterium]|nr:DUF1559 domain-containing protein [Pirellulales bacterium]
MDWRITLDGEPSRSGFTWKEVLAVVVVLGVLIALVMPPACCASREAARRIQCTNNLKQIGLAIHNYAQANKVLPPGTICSTEPIEPGNQYDVWAEAAKTEPGFHGTSFLLRIMPFIESGNWNWSKGRHPGTIANCWTPAGNAGTKDYPYVAVFDVGGFYCPTRRNGLRPEDHTMMLASWWPGGGTDYGGCAGRHAAFTLGTGYNLCDASTFYEPNFYPEPFTADDDPEKKRWGIFGRVNVSTKFDEIRDGTSNTIMTGELQRITDITPGSKDGWAIGGPATLFTTGAMVRYDGNKLEFVAQSGEGKLMNNRFFGSPGSEHSGGAHFGMADGSVRFMSDSMDPRVFALMGSMADGEEVSPAP